MGCTIGSRGEVQGERSWWWWWW